MFETLDVGFAEGFSWGETETVRTKEILKEKKHEMFSLG